MGLPVFPSLPGLAWPVKRTPRWLNVENDALSAKRIRVPLWTYPVYLYELSYNVLRLGTLAEWQQLVAFIHSVQGSAQLWQYSDPNDNAVTNQLFGAGDGVTAGPFQLVRTLGGFTEPVFLVNGAPTISIAGTPTLAFTVSAYGEVTFNAPPANGAALTWTGAYYWGCRFDGETFPFTQSMSTFFKAGPLKFSTEKMP